LRVVVGTAGVGGVCRDWKPATAKIGKTEDLRLLELLVQFGFVSYDWAHKTRKVGASCHWFDKLMRLVFEADEVPGIVLLAPFVDVVAALRRPLEIEGDSEGLASLEQDVHKFTQALCITKKRQTTNACATCKDMLFGNLRALSAMCQQKGLCEEARVLLTLLQHLWCLQFIDPTNVNLSASHSLLHARNLCDSGCGHSVSCRVCAVGFSVFSTLRDKCVDEEERNKVTVASNQLVSALAHLLEKAVLSSHLKAVERNLKVMSWKFVFCSDSFQEQRGLRDCRFSAKHRGLSLNRDEGGLLWKGFNGIFLCVFLLAQQ
jgi:hypothetical protein